MQDKKHEVLEVLCDSNVLSIEPNATDVGRLTIDEIDGVPTLTAVFGLKNSYRYDYKQPEVQSGFFDYFDMCRAVAEDNMVTAVDCARKIQKEVLEVRLPHDARDLNKKIVSQMEYALIERVDLHRLAEENELVLTLLNPSPGTITRFSKNGIYCSIYIVSNEYDSKYKKELLDRVIEETYPYNVVYFDTYKHLPEGKLFYMGHSADKGQKYDVENYIGFSLDPYWHMSRGGEFVSYTETKYGCYANYTRDSYIGTLYYYKECNVFRYATQSVTNFLSTTPKWDKVANNHTFTLNSSIYIDLDALEPQEDVIVPVDVQRYNVTNLSIKNNGEYKFLSATEKGRRVLLDVISPETMDRRDKYLRKESIAGNIAIASPITSGPFTHERHPSVNYLVIAPIPIKVESTVVETEMEEIRVQSEVKLVHSDMIRLSSNSFALPSNIDLARIKVVIIAFKPEDHKVWIRPSFLCTRDYILPVHKKQFINSNDEYYLDLYDRCLKKGKGIAIDNTLFSALFDLRYGERGKVRYKGYCPKYGPVIGELDYYTGIQAFKRSNKGTILVYKNRTGQLIDVKTKEKYTLGFDQMYGKTYTLQKMIMQPSVSANTYSVLVGTAYNTIGHIGAVDLSDITFDSDGISYGDIFSPEHSSFVVGADLELDALII